MNVGQVARDAGLPSKTIRYYDEIGLVSPDRARNGYRSYSEDDVHRLSFLKRARNLGFSLDECRQLLLLYGDKERSSQDVQRIARAHVDEIEAKIAELQSMSNTLQHLISACYGDERPDCPILEDLARS